MPLCLSYYYCLCISTTTTTFVSISTATRTLRIISKFQRTDMRLNLCILITRSRKNDNNCNTQSGSCSKLQRTKIPLYLSNTRSESCSKLQLMNMQQQIFLCLSNTQSESLCSKLQRTHMQQQIPLYLSSAQSESCSNLQRTKTPLYPSNTAQSESYSKLRQRMDVQQARLYLDNNNNDNNNNNNKLSVLFGM